jgi:protein Mpv17
MRGAIFGILKRNPLASAAVLTGTKTSLADLFVQTCLEGKHFPQEMDTNRNLVFLNFGFFYQGGFQYLIFGPLLEKLFPAREAVLTAGRKSAATAAVASISSAARWLPIFKKVAFTMCLVDPFLFFPVFYFVKELVTGKDSQQDNIVEVMSLSATGPPQIGHVLSTISSTMGSIWEATCNESVRVWKQNVVSDCAANILIWLPGHLVTFSLPTHLRMPWVAGVSSLWCVLLSWRRGSREANSSDSQADSATSV